MAPCLCRHLDPDPVCSQYAERPGTHSIPCQYIKTAVPIEGVVGLVQVEEYVMEDFLLHRGELLQQISFEGSGPRSSHCLKAMHIIMELDGRRYLEIDDAGYFLPQELHHDNPSEVGPPHPPPPWE